MTREKMRKRFGKLKKAELIQKTDIREEKAEIIENDWTEEEILAVAKRVAKRLGITIPFYSGEE